MLKGRTLLLATSALVFAIPAHAQQAPAAADSQAGAAPADDQIIVTAVPRGANRLDSSISVSSLGAEAIANAAPRSAAELFRSLPGIRAESSGGEGNANIQVRGIPISTGGACRDPEGVFPARTARKVFTILSSSEWKVTTQSRPPTFKARSAASSPASSSLSSSFTAIRIA